jgi:hypothetical protein
MKSNSFAVIGPRDRLPIRSSLSFAGNPTPARENTPFSPLSGSYTKNEELKQFLL